MNADRGETKHLVGRYFAGWIDDVLEE